MMIIDQKGTIMTTKFLIAAAALLASTPLAHARDDVIIIPLQEVFDLPESKSKLDGTVAFHFAGQPALKVRETLGEDLSNKKAMLSSKDERLHCRQAAFNALFTFQESAKRQGANAVIDFVNYYNKHEARTDPPAVECHVGTWAAGVVLKGSYAKIEK
jgi:uncharacterized protein YbjQ (UPF0145 family)